MHGSLHAIHQPVHKAHTEPGQEVDPDGARDKQADAVEGHDPSLNHAENVQQPLPCRGFSRRWSHRVWNYLGFAFTGCLPAVIAWTTHSTAWTITASANPSAGIGNLLEAITFAGGMLTVAGTLGAFALFRQPGFYTFISLRHCLALTAAGAALGLAGVAIIDSVSTAAWDANTYARRYSFLLILYITIGAGALIAAAAVKRIEVRPQRRDASGNEQANTDDANIVDDNA